MKLPKNYSFEYCDKLNRHRIIRPDGSCTAWFVSRWFVYKSEFEKHDKSHV